MHRKLPGTITHGRRNGSRTQRPWLDPEAFIQQALELLASDRYLQKGMGLMALTGRRPAEIFFSASFSLPPKKLPIPPSSSTADSKPARLPAPASSLTNPLPSTTRATKSDAVLRISGRTLQLWLVELWTRIPLRGTNKDSKSSRRSFQGERRGSAERHFEVCEAIGPSAPE